MPYSSWPNANGSLIAQASEIPRISWAGRAVYAGQNLHNRLSLMDTASGACLAVFDKSPFSINDVSFHPTKPVVAIATGEYDGGYQFEGNLWAWNWETGAAASLLPESREVIRCRWDGPDACTVLLRPRHEEEFPGDPFETFVSTTLSGASTNLGTGMTPALVEANPRLEDLQPIDPTKIGFKAPASASVQRERNQAASGTDDAFERRTRVWDLSWITPELLAAVTDQSIVEVWDTRSGERTFVERGQCHGVELVPTDDGAFVNATHPANHDTWTGSRSTLYKVTPTDVTTVREFDWSISISTDLNGNLLCRDVGSSFGNRHGRDAVLDPHGNEIARQDLGHYDCFNHWIRLNGGDTLYYLRGTPAKSHAHKVLCSIKPNGATQELMAWDPADGHYMESNAILVASTQLVRAYQVYSAPKRGAVRIERMDIARGSEPAWQRTLPASVTCLATHDDRLLYALTNGTVGMLDLQTGELLGEELLEHTGVTSIATALSVRGSTLAIGTIDGRILLAEIPA